MHEEAHQLQPGVDKRETDCLSITHETSPHVSRCHSLIDTFHKLHLYPILTYTIALLFYIALNS